MRYGTLTLYIVNFFYQISLVVSSNTITVQNFSMYNILVTTKMFYSNNYKICNLLLCRIFCIIIFDVVIFLNQGHGHLQNYEQLIIRKESSSINRVVYLYLHHIWSSIAYLTELCLSIIEYLANILMRPEELCQSRSRLTKM